jgi:hypothetical protein
MPRERRVNAGIGLSMNLSARYIKWTMAAGVVAAILWLATAGWYHGEPIVAATFLVGLAAPGLRAIRQLSVEACEFDR